MAQNSPIQVNEVSSTSYPTTGSSTSLPSNGPVQDSNISSTVPEPWVYVIADDEIMHNEFEIMMERLFG